MIFWLLGLWKDANLFIACLGGGLFSFIALLKVLLYLPEGGATASKLEREGIQEGFDMFGVAAAIFIFGMPAFLLLCALMVVLIVVGLYKAVKIALGRA